MCPHNMVLSFLAHGFHLSKADLPDIKESALKVLHCHPKGFCWSPDSSDYLSELSKVTQWHSPRWPLWLWSM